MKLDSINGSVRVVFNSTAEVAAFMEWLIDAAEYDAAEYGDISISISPDKKISTWMAGEVYLRYINSI